MAVNITQFFLLLNHQLISLILDKAEFYSKISLCFSDYLVSRKTCYLWNDFISSSFNTNVGIRQGSALSPILLILFIALIFHIFEKRIKNLKILILFISFVNNSFFIFQKKSLDKNNTYLFIAITSSHSYWSNLILLLSIEKQNSFTFPDCIIFLILLYWILVK